MENTKAHSNAGLRNTVIVVAAIIFIVMGYYAVMGILGVNRKIDYFNRTFGMGSAKSQLDSLIQFDSTFLRLQKEKVFLQSKIAMAESDSIGLTLNFIDSVAKLEINGVTVHAVRMDQFAISSVFRQMNAYSLYQLLAKPFVIRGDTATIKKEPLMVKMAPRDTSEYKPDVIPDTTDHELVNYILYLDHGIKLYFYQFEDTIPMNRRAHAWFDLHDRLARVKRETQSLIRFEVPDYQPFIRVSLPKSEAKILYRALPCSGLVAIYL